MDAGYDSLTSLLQLVPWKEILPVITALVGYAGGVFSEPIKRFLVTTSERNRLRTALYAELTKNLDSGFFFGVMSNEVKNRPTFTDYVDKYLDLSCYYEARQQPVLFAQLKEYGVFSNIYQVLCAIKSASNTEQERIKVLGELLTYVDHNIKNGRLSRRIMHDRTIVESQFRNPIKQWLLGRYSNYRWAKARKRNPDVKVLDPNWLSRYLGS